MHKGFDDDVHIQVTAHLTNINTLTKTYTMTAVGERNTFAMTQLGFASVFALAALACVAVSFSTDYWVVTTVDRSDAEDDNLAPAELARPYAFTRNRGLFRTCYDGNDTLCKLVFDTCYDGNDSLCKCLAPATMATTRCVSV